jgi:hypothetical protein
MQQDSRAILNFKSDAKSLVKMKDKYDEWIKKGRMTVEEVAEEMKPDMDKVEADLKVVIIPFVNPRQTPNIDHVCDQRPSAKLLRGESGTYLTLKTTTPRSPGRTRTPTFQRSCNGSRITHRRKRHDEDHGDDSGSVYWYHT